MKYVYIVALVISVLILGVLDLSQFSAASRLVLMFIIVFPALGLLECHKEETAEEVVKLLEKKRVCC